jgi:hypothetical protein
MRIPVAAQRASIPENFDTDGAFNAVMGLPSKNTFGRVELAARDTGITNQLH